MEQDPDASMAIPDPLRGRGRLFLWPDQEATRGRLEGLARTLSVRLERFESFGCLALHLEERRVLDVLDGLRKGLEPVAVAKTLALFKRELDEPSLADFPRADSLSTFIAFARAQWLGDLITSRRLAAWFQPIVDARRPERVVALEALARGVGLNSSDPPILPARLLSAARDAGLMCTFDRFMHEDALTRFNRPSSSALELFLNVAPRTLEDPNFDLDRLQEVAAAHGVAPRRVVLEIIESETIEDLGRMQDILTHARSLGFGIALDDLGAGFSNLNLIHQLRPDVVKLDMALIRDIAADGYKAVIAQKILEATRNLGVRTVAEGVELRSELAWLSAHGVDCVQGYFIGRPAPEPSRAGLPVESLSA